MYYIVLDNGDIHSSHFTLIQDIKEAAEALKVARKMVSDLVILGYRDVFCLVRKQEDQMPPITICNFSPDFGWENFPSGI